MFKVVDTGNDQRVGPGEFARATTLLREWGFATTEVEPGAVSRYIGLCRLRPSGWEPVPDKLALRSAFRAVWHARIILVPVRCQLMPGRRTRETFAFWFCCVFGLFRVQIAPRCGN